MTQKTGKVPIFQLTKRSDFRLFRDELFSKNVVLRKREHQFEGSIALSIFRQVMFIFDVSDE